jgi:hypothetical protein
VRSLDTSTKDFVSRNIGNNFDDPKFADSDETVRNAVLGSPGKLHEGVAGLSFRLRRTHLTYMLRPATLGWGNRNSMNSMRSP